MSQLIGQTIIQVKSTQSTNNYATSQVFDNEVKEGAVFLAYEQTAGRGQLSNIWESEPGMNLTFSILLNPNFLEIRQQFMLSKVICLGLEAFLSRLLVDVKIKWPNDIYIGDKKICGILIENSIMNATILQSIVGIGLNVNQEKFLSDAPNPVSLKMLIGESFQLDNVLSDLLHSIDMYYKILVKNDHQNINAAFTKKLYQLNELKWYKDDSHQYQGEIQGVNEIGQLLVQELNGPLHEYHFKEVSYLP